MPDSNCIDSKKLGNNAKIMSVLRHSVSTEHPVSSIKISPARPPGLLRFLSTPVEPVSSSPSPCSPGDIPSRWRAALNNPISPGLGEHIELNYLRTSRNNLGHNFTLTTNEEITVCDVCDKHIWNLTYKTFRCDNCQLTCHSECCHSIQEPCTNFRRARSYAIDNDSLSLDNSMDEIFDDVNHTPTYSPAQSPSVVMRRAPSLNSPSRHAAPPTSNSLQRERCFSLLRGGLSYVDDFDNDVTISDDEMAPKRRSRTASLTSLRSSSSLRFSYDFTSLDRESIRQFHIQVEEKTSSESTPPSQNDVQLSTPSFDWPVSVEQLSKRIMVFNQNNQGLDVKLSPDRSLECLGTVRVHINLIRPIKMLIKARPSSIFDVVGGVASEEEETENGVVGMKSFHLPRGSTKLLYVSSSTPAQVVISSLLKKFHINDNPQKFSLYEHTIKGDTQVHVRRLSGEECPLRLVLGWSAGGVDEFNAILEVKRLVVQENETGDILWNEFSVPELKTFLTILAREEREYEDEILQKYNLRQREILRLLGREEVDLEIIQKRRQQNGTPTRS